MLNLTFDVYTQTEIIWNICYSKTYSNNGKKKLTACLIVRGKPSRMKPDSPLASPASSLLDNKAIIISSDTSFPWLTPVS